MPTITWLTTEYKTINGRKVLETVHFDFIVPASYNGVHIRWKNTLHTEFQEQYEIGPATAQGELCEYTINLHGSECPKPQDWKVQYVRIHHDLLRKTKWTVVLWI